MLLGPSLHSTAGEVPEDKGSLISVLWIKPSVVGTRSTKSSTDCAFSNPSRLCGCLGFAAC